MILTEDPPDEEEYETDDSFDSTGSEFDHSVSVYAHPSCGS